MTLTGSETDENGFGLSDPVFYTVEGHEQVEMPAAVPGTYLYEISFAGQTLSGEVQFVDPQELLEDYEIGNAITVQAGSTAYYRLETDSEEGYYYHALQGADGLSVSLRLRKLLKISYTIYIVLEALIMVLELNEPKLDFYRPYSLWLAIIHAVVSGLVCFAFLQLDPDNTKYEISLVVCIGLIFFGMLGAIFGIRVYFSVVINAVSFSLLFGIIRFFLSREEIEIDCYGDRASVAEFSSTIFIDPEELKKSRQKIAAEEKAKAEKQQEETAAEKPSDVPADK